MVRLWPRSWEDSRTDLGATFRMLTGRGEIVAGSRSRQWDRMEFGWRRVERRRMVDHQHWDGGNRPRMRPRHR